MKTTGRDDVVQTAEGPVETAAGPAVQTAEGPARAVDVQVTATVTGPVAQAPSTVTKVVVAVHGVGDQYTFAAIQSVVNQFCSFYNHPAGVPLGSFHTGETTFSLPAPYPREPFERFAFAEVYWAKIPRTAVDDKHTLEESKKWARTIVERLRLRWRAKGEQGGYTERDFRLVKQILSEMIQTIAVVDRICYLAERAGLFTFDLRKLLEDYLGDVQIVTEFGRDRTKILEAFRSVMEKAHATHDQADIYVVAHSEGTVIAFLALLDAFRQPQRPEWANHVRGLMTLGSPIDKHLVLWPELFGEGPPKHTPDEPIHWRNYYDRGDPIGFALDDARSWLAVHGWRGVFEFEPNHDHGFVRYPLPGKAHVDYWGDDAVFGHFIRDVVKEPPPDSEAPRRAEFDEPPADLQMKKWLSYLLPYVGIAALLVLAVYIQFKAVTDALDPEHAVWKTTFQMFQGVIRTTMVIFGITVAARLPRLTRNGWLRLAGLSVGLATCGLYYLTAPVPPPSPTGATTEIFGLPPGVPTALLGAGIIGLAYLFGVFLPSLGAVPLMISASIGVVAKVIYHVRTVSDVGPLWPVFLTTALFLYLWWLAVLIFDLVVIWHWYIRKGRLLARMDELMGGKRGDERSHQQSRTASSKYAPQVQQ
jgi:hypothetical protein